MCTDSAECITRIYLQTNRYTGTAKQACRQTCLHNYIQNERETERERERRASEIQSESERDNYASNEGRFDIQSPGPGESTGQDDDQVQ